MNHFGGTNINRYRLVQVYFNTPSFKYVPNSPGFVESATRERVGIYCYVIDGFFTHRKFQGITQYLNETTNLHEEIKNNIIDTASDDISHKDINQGIALLISNADKVIY